MDPNVFGDGSVESGEPISWAVMIALILVMIKWLATPSISPLPGYVNLSLISAGYSSYSWLAIVLIPFTMLMLIRKVLDEDGEPQNKPAAIVNHYTMVLKARSQRLKESGKESTLHMLERREAKKKAKAGDEA